MINVNNSTTTLTFTAPSLPDGVFTVTVVVMVTAVNRFGVGPPSDLVIVKVNGMLVTLKAVLLHMYVTGLAKRVLHMCTHLNLQV